MNKIFILCVAVLMLSACGRTPLPLESKAQEEISPDISQDLTNFEGIYNLTELTYDSDQDVDVTTPVTVSTVLRNVFVTENGTDKFKQALLETATLRLQNGTYKLSYKIINGSDQVEEIGLFSEGAQSGTYDIMSGLNNTAIIRFYPTDGQSAGFASAETDEAAYYAWIENAGTYFYTDMPTPDGSYLTEIKGKKSN